MKENKRDEQKSRERKVTGKPNKKAKLVGPQRAQRG